MSSSILQSSHRPVVQRKISSSKKTKHESSCPIGIFDSGVGGLTVARAVKEILPNENIVYFGDTANMPYGDKSKSDIQSYSCKIINFLHENDCKLIIIACNSATAAENDYLREIIPSNFVLMNVVDPVVAYLAKNYAGKRIGLIATKQTVLSKIYDKKIQGFNAGIKLHSLATGLLAPAIEEFDNDLLVKVILDEYLSHPSLNGIDAIVLGCTHYPIIKNKIAEFYHNKMDIVDTSNVVAQAVKRKLTKNNSLNTNTSGSIIFFVSEYRDSFTAKARSLFRSDSILVNQYIF